jgi:hypothetical protein
MQRRRMNVGGSSERKKDLKDTVALEEGFVGSVVGIDVVAEADLNQKLLKTPLSKPLLQRHPLLRRQAKSN